MSDSGFTVSKGCLSVVLGLLFFSIGIPVLITMCTGASIIGLASMNAKTKQMAAQPASPTPAYDLETEKRARAAATEKYPGLAIKGSAMNKLFLARYQKLQAENSPVLRDPNWPLKIADDVAGGR